MRFYCWGLGSTSNVDDRVVNTRLAPSLIIWNRIVLIAANAIGMHELCCATRVRPCLLDEMQALEALSAEARWRRPFAQPGQDTTVHGGSTTFVTLPLIGWPWPASRVTGDHFAEAGLYNQ
jgi:hypothetical protein